MILGFVCGLPFLSLFLFCPSITMTESRLEFFREDPFAILYSVQNILFPLLPHPLVTS